MLASLRPIPQARGMSGAAQADARRPGTGPDFSHVDAWVFDLDHTLYTFDAAGQAEMEERICRYVQRHFDLPRDAAWEMQKHYLKEYGSTLAGLMVNQRIDPDAYHDAINDIEALELKRNDALRAGLERLPGRRLVFTNNCGVSPMRCWRGWASTTCSRPSWTPRRWGFSPSPSRPPMPHC